MQFTTFEEKAKFATLLFLASEATFFLFLIIAYGLFNYSLTQGPTAASSLHPLRSGMYTIALLSSSITLWAGTNSLQRGHSAGFKRWLVLTILLGAIFLVGQGLEYLELLRNHITISRNLFGTTFFTLTGFHGIHVIVGLILLVILFGLAFYLDFQTPQQIAAAESISYYWHFVDGVWVVIFSMIYLWTAHAL